MTPLNASQAAAINTAHVVHGVNAAGAYLGLVPRASAAAVAAGPSPGPGWLWQAGTWHPPAPNAAALAETVRQSRNARLTASDWVVVRASEVGQPIPTAWLAYRAALRDVPAQAGFPHTVSWPVPPAA